MQAVKAVVANKQILLVIAFLSVSVLSGAETIVFTSGEVVHADIIEADQASITTLGKEGAMQKYDLGGIVTIDSIDARRTINDIVDGLNSEIAVFGKDFHPPSLQTGVQQARNKKVRPDQFLKPALIHISFLPIALFIGIGLLVLVRFLFYNQ